jgi:hypothetical protein
MKKDKTKIRLLVIEDNRILREGIISILKSHSDIKVITGSGRSENTIKRLHTEKRILTTPTGDNTDYSINFIPAMKVESLMEGYNKVLDTIFAPKNYYKRIITYLKEYNNLAVKAKKLLRSELKTLSKVV